MTGCRAEAAPTAEEEEAIVDASTIRWSAVVHRPVEACDQRFAVTNDMCFPFCGADGQDDV
ncbi:hypothetical protein DQP58_12850 [Mycobacterium colombiense]|uniref:Uncharacterized protein n=1 Tax=Mycobacterium colombiense TaxID=339268 RepID=A0A329KK66_9MYCO|nr:hypothetical protein DQP58_12850 [Mycobacterium colombiense]